MDVEFHRRFRLEAYPEKRRLIRGYILLAVFAVLCIGLGYHAWNRAHVSGDAQTDVVDVADSIRYLDEVLTMSARMAALTADPKWDARYREAAQRLAAVLVRARALAPYANAALEQIEDSNRRLVSRETAALALVRNGEASKATEMLDTTGYAAEKAAYAEGLRRFAEQLELDQLRREELIRRELIGFGLIAFVLVAGMASVLYANHNLLVRRIELEQALGTVAHRLIRADASRLDVEIQSVLRLLAGRSHAAQAWFLQRSDGALPRLTNSWLYALPDGSGPDPKAILRALAACEPDANGTLTLNGSHGPALRALGVTGLEGVSLDATNQHFMLALVGSSPSPLRWNHREAAILRSIGEVLARAVENRTLQEQLLRLATTDGLTGLLNRRHFTEALQRAWSRANASPLPTAVLMLDIDHFKDVNDRFGHAAGDAVLVHLGRLLHEHLRDIDIVARIGGEEFAVLLPGTEQEGAVEAAERLRETIAATPAVAEGARIAFTVSIGLTLIVPADLDANEALKRADHALYAAKAAGRNCVRQCPATLPKDT